MLEHYSDRLRPEKRAEFFQRIRDSIETMTLLVNDVLIYSKAEENRVEIKSSRISLEAFCRGLVDEFNLINPAESPTVHFEWTCGCTMSNPYVEIDQKLLRHILQNLLSNAIKYAPGTSQVAFVVVCKPGNFWIEIRDQGIGIPAEDLPYLFEPFHRASNTGPISGTGLGLAIVKQYVDLLGGTISVKSEVDHGTVFSLFLECDTSR
jgi:signal transduction histidine kinase